MSFSDIDRRLRRIEAGRGSGAPTLIFSDRPRSEPGERGELADAIANWRDWTADGRAELCGNVLVIVGPEITEEAWEARFCTEREQMR